MSKNSIVAIVVVIVLIVGGWYFLSSKQVSAPSIDTVDQEIDTISQETGATTTPATGVGKTVIIVYSDSGYTPSAITISLGDTVIFKNESSVDMWPASVMHPTHTVYPDSDIKKCGTSAEVGMFDSCKGYAPGTSWSFVFNDKGSWGFHDHLNAKRFGKITVE